MKEVYNIITLIKEHFKAEPLINTVKFGDVKEVDLNKTTIFPLTHFWIERAAFQGRTLTFTLNFMVLCTVDQVNTEAIENGSDTELNENIFKYGEDNLIDVLNETWAVVNRFLVEFMDYRGDYGNAQYVLVGEPEANMLYEEMENKLSGWGFSMTIEVPNDKYDACAGPTG